MKTESEESWNLFNKSAGFKTSFEICGQTSFEAPLSFRRSYVQVIEEQRPSLAVERKPLKTVSVCYLKLIMWTSAGLWTLFSCSEIPERKLVFNSGLGIAVCFCEGETFHAFHPNTVIIYWSSSRRTTHEPVTHSLGNPGLMHCNIYLFIQPHCVNGG